MTMTPSCTNLRADSWHRERAGMIVMQALPTQLSVHSDRKWRLREEGVLLR